MSGSGTFRCRGSVGKEILLVIFLGLLCLSGAAPRSKRPAVFQVAVCDLDRVFASYRKWKDMLEILKLRRKKKQAEVDRLCEELKSLRQKIKEAAPDSPGYTDLQAELIKKEAFAKAALRQYEMELQQSEQRQYEAVLREVISALSALAEERGISVVLQRTLNLPDARWDCVLYAERSVDLTEPLIRRLNEGYSKRKKS